MTLYEIIYHPDTFGGQDGHWSTWARLTKEVSNVMVVVYAAYNPIAYCGSLILPFVMKIGRSLLPCIYPNTVSSKSELEMMKSIGITLNGADPLHQQLR